MAAESLSVPAHRRTSGRTQPIQEFEDAKILRLEKKQDIKLPIVGTTIRKHLKSYANHICRWKSENDINTFVSNSISGCEYLFVILSNATVWGFATVFTHAYHTPLLDPPAPICDDDDWYIDLMCANGPRGTGVRLLDYIKSDAREAGMQQLRLYAKPLRESFWRNRGFVEKDRMEDATETTKYYTSPLGMRWVYPENSDIGAAKAPQHLDSLIMQQVHKGMVSDDNVITFDPPIANVQNQTYRLKNGILVQPLLYDIPSGKRMTLAL